VEPDLKRGSTKNGTVLVEGMAEVRFKMFVKSCSGADYAAEVLEEAIEDPYNPIVDGAVRALFLN